MPTHDTITLFLPHLADGGAERVFLNLAAGLIARNVPVEIVAGTAEGVFASRVPREARLVDLKARRMPWVVPRLARYLATSKPRAVVAALIHGDLAAVGARIAARSAVPVIATVHSHFSTEIQRYSRFKRLAMIQLVRSGLRRTDAVVAVSRAVADDLAAYLDREIQVIYNPVVSASTLERARMPVDHPWFVPAQPPVIISAGRLAPPKDFATLVEAFAVARKVVNCRLMILGEGPDRAALMDRARALAIEDDVALPGFVENPYAFFSRSPLFALSSRYEGLPTVLIEAMACGCTPVVTDAPGGSREIVEGGTYGTLVAPGDVRALAGAIVRALAEPLSAELLRRRAEEFSVERGTQRYLDLIARLANG